MVDIWNVLTSGIDINFFIGTLVAFIIIYVIVSKKIGQEIKWPIFGLIISSIISYISAYLLKIIFHIPRLCAGQVGCPSDFSFPSEHATIIFSIAMFVVLYKKDWKLSIVFLAFAGLISISRVLAGFHTLIDIVVGALLGILIAYLIHANRDRILRLINFI
jgi:undecaprenyl-diphosphatase